MAILKHHTDWFQRRHERINSAERMLDSYLQRNYIGQPLNIPCIGPECPWGSMCLEEVRLLLTRYKEHWELSWRLDDNIDPSERCVIFN